MNKLSEKHKTVKFQVCITEEMRERVKERYQELRKGSVGNYVRSLILRDLRL
jgi:hypothetical protein